MLQGFHTAGSGDYSFIYRFTFYTLTTCAQNQKYQSDLVFQFWISWVCPSAASRKNFILRLVKKMSALLVVELAETKRLPWRGSNLLSC